VPLASLSSTITLFGKNVCVWHENSVLQNNFSLL